MPGHQSGSETQHRPLQGVCWAEYGKGQGEGHESEGTAGAAESIPERRFQRHDRHVYR